MSYSLVGQNIKMLFAVQPRLLVNVIRQLRLIRGQVDVDVAAVGVATGLVELRLVARITPVDVVIIAPINS